MRKTPRRVWAATTQTSRATNGMYFLSGTVIMLRRIAASLIHHSLSVPRRNSRLGRMEFESLHANAACDDPGDVYYPDWFPELRYDGFRAIAVMQNVRCSLISRRGCAVLTKRTRLTA